MFLKDLLIIDFEGGVGPKQIGAVLLDKDTLEEKKIFSSYIYFDMKGKPSLSSGITQDMLDNAPSQAEVGKKVFEIFGSDILLGSFIADIDFRHFRTIISSASIDQNLYDYHFLDIWPIAYTYLLKNGYKGDIRSDSIFQEFGIPKRGKHDALEDARIASQILRRVMLN